MNPCPDVTTLRQLQEGRLSEAEYGAVEAHVQECLSCQEALDALGTLPTAVPFLLGGAARTPEKLPLVPGYEVLEVLGAGGMGVVYKARQTTLNRLVALKMILGGSYASEDQVRRFYREAEAVARLQHPNIVQIHEIGQAEGRPYFTMELVEGGSLRLKPARRTYAEIAALVEQLARAMYYAHERGIVHRDLKPGNVLLTTEGVPKIADFGLARHLDADHSLTPTGGLLGTPAYMAPEQAAGSSKNDPVTPVTDVYALGAILYELLVGRPPFEGLSRDETLYMVRHVEPVPPCRLRPRVSRDLETICLKCLRKEPGKRYASAQALADDVARFREGRPILARPVGRLERSWTWCRRNPAVAGLLAALMLTFVAGSVVAATGWRLELWQRHRAEARARHIQRVASELFGWVDRELRLQQPGTETLRRDMARMVLGQVEEYQSLVREDQGPDAPVELARTEWWRGCLTRVSASPGEAEPVLRQVIALQEKLRTDHPQKRELCENLALSYQSLAVVQGELKQHEEAMRLLHRTCELLKPLVKEESPSSWSLATLAGTYNNLGLYASRDANPTQAQTYLNEAHDLWERAGRADPNEPRLRAGLAFNCVNQANLAAQMGEPARALEWYEKARVILEQLLQEHPGTGAFIDALTITLHDLAALHTRQERTGDALAVLDKARAVRVALVQNSPETLSMRRYEAENELWLGRVKLARKDRAGALAHFRRSCDLLDGLKGPLDGLHNRQRMRAHTYLGIVQATQILQRSQALASLRTALDLLKKGGETTLERIEDPREQAETCFLLGAGLMNLGSRAETIPPFQQAVVYGRTALARVPHSLVLRKELSRSYFHLGEMLRSAGRPAEAAATSRERRQLWPDNADELFDAASELCRCAEVIVKGKKEPAAAEQAECRRYLDEAMEVLRQALAKGLTGAEQTRQDKDFRLLQDRPDFKELVAEIERRERQGRK